MRYFLQKNKYIATDAADFIDKVSFKEVDFLEVLDGVIHGNVWGITIIDGEVVSMIGSTGTPILSVGHGPVLGVNFKKTNKTVTHAIKGTRQTISSLGEHYIAKFEILDGLPEWILDYDHIITIDDIDHAVHVSTNNDSDALSMRLLL